MERGRPRDPAPVREGHLALVRELALPSGLPADALVRDGSGWSRSLMHTSPTNIAAYLWSVLAAERLHLIGPAEARSRLDRTLATLAGMDRTHGFFVNELDPRTGAPLKFPEAGPGPPASASPPWTTPGWPWR